MSQDDFLVEIGTEELPPKALKKISEAFGNGIRQGLEEAELPPGELQLFATPRRLAVRVAGLPSAQPDRTLEKRGPSVKAPQKAVAGFARSCGVTPDELERLATAKGDYYLFRKKQPGQATRWLLSGIVEESLARLPIPKRMRWGARRTEFVRPVHWVLMLFGDEVVEAEILGRPAGRTTYGHRFHYNKAIELTAPAEYERILAECGYVIADFAKRRVSIEEQVKRVADELQGEAVIDADLLDEVTALVEWPVALSGRFDERFLEVPAEALVSSMKEHQKYFHLLDSEGHIKPQFITVANIQSRHPQQVVSGNEKVIRPRLADAAFFYETDKKRTLESRVARLKPIVFQAQLGTLYDKSRRVAALCAAIAERIGGNPNWAERAGRLAKTDLVTEMVLEFTDLQGVMGCYYARHDGEPEEVAKALWEQYLPRFSGDQIPGTATGSALAIADRLDTLVGLFGIDQPPSGSKDPFALRRATLGVLHIIVEQKLDLDLRELLALAADLYPDLPAREGLETRVLNFMLERFRAWYSDQGVPAEVFLAVMAKPSSKPLEFDKRVQAVNHFRSLPQAEALAAANKRVANILAKQGDPGSEAPDDALFQEEAERVLDSEIQALDSYLSDRMAAQDFKATLEKLASLQPGVDRFFDEVMVMTDDEDVRANRLRLLNQLRQRFLLVADIALLG